MRRCWIRSIPIWRFAIEMRAADASMATAEFVAGAVRAFIDSADDDLWFKLLTEVG